MFIMVYMDVEEMYCGDLDFFNLVCFLGVFLLGQGQDFDVSYLSQEICFVLINDLRVCWIVGGYYFEMDCEFLMIFFLDIDGIIGGFVLFFFIGEDNDNLVYVGFGQFDFDLGDKWGLSVGVCYDKDECEQVDMINGGDCECFFDEVQFWFLFKYLVNFNFMGYVILVCGFCFGGYNVLVILFDFFELEMMDNFEVGFKLILVGGWVCFNGVVYLMDVENFQFFQVDIVMVL